MLVTESPDKNNIKKEQQIIAKGTLSDILTKINIKSKQDRTSENIGQLKSLEQISIYEFNDEWVKIAFKSKKDKVGFVKRDFINIIDNTEQATEISDIDSKLTNKVISLNELNKANIKKELTISNTLLDIDLAKPNQVESEIIKLAQNITDTIKNNDKEKLKIKERKKDDFKGKKLLNNDGIVAEDVFNLAVRKGPGETFYVVSYLLPKEQIKVIERDGDWYHIIYNTSQERRFGYVEAMYIDLK